jgi:DNA primase
MSYNSSTLEEIKSRLDIVDVISEYVPLKKTGQNWKGLCPFHSEKTPSFIVSPSKQIYHCFGCGSGGDIFTFLNKYENLSFKESLDVLAKKAGVQLKKFRRDAVTVEGKETLLKLHRDALVFYQQRLKQNPKAMNYLKNRGLNGEALELFSIGYAPDLWDALFSYLKNKGYKIEIINKAGLITHGSKGYYDTFRNRIIFPIFDLRGEVIAFGGRVMSESIRSGDDSIPKYLNSPETPVFNKGRILYGLNLAKDAIKKAGFVIFVEGYIDVITTHIYGFANAVAPLGTALTQEHGKLIKRFTQEAVLVFDGDASGVKAAKSGVNILLESGLNVRVLLLPEGEDPDSILRKRGKDAFDNLLKNAVSVVDFFVMQSGSDQYRKGDISLVAHDALEAISKIPSSVRQGYYVRLLSERLKINELFIREELRKIKKRPQSESKYIVNSLSARAGGAQLKSRPMDEIYLLQLILQFPEKSHEIFDAVSEEDFEDHITRALFKKMRVRIDSYRDGLADYNILISECEEEERNLLTELLFKLERLDSEAELADPEKIFRDCLKRIKSKKRQMLLHELQDKIKRAELDKNDGLLRSLLLERQKLVKEG